MMKSVLKIDWNNTRHAIPAFVTIIVMPLSYSIAYGIIGGLAMALLIFVTDKTVEGFYYCLPNNNNVFEPEPVELQLESEDVIEDKIELTIVDHEDSL